MVFKYFLFIQILLNKIQISTPPFFLEVFSDLFSLQPWLIFYFFEFPLVSVFWQ